MSHPNGYTKEDIKRILGTSWPTMPEDCLLYTSPSPRD